MTSFRNRDNLNVEAVVDKSSGAAVGIDFAHEAVHRDVIVQATDYATGISAARNYLFKTPAGPDSIHLIFAVMCSGAARVEFLEGATASSDGTEITAQRLNRPSVKAILGKIYHTPTITDAGTKIQDLYNGGTGAGGQQKGGQAAAHNDAEWLLKPDTKYILRVTPANSSTLSVMLEWYEV